MVLWVCAFQAIGQGVDFTHLYNPKAELSVDHQLVQDGDKLTLLLTLKINNRNYQLYDYDFEIYNLENYSSNLDSPIDTDNYDSAYLDSKGTSHYFKYNIRVDQLLPLIILEVKNRKIGFSLFFDIPLYSKAVIALNGTSDYVPVGDWSPPTEVAFNAESIFCFYYDEEFPLGLPPMVTRDNFNDKELKVDSSFTAGSPLTLKNQGLYLLMTDTASNDGVAVRIVDEYYPKMTSIQQLVEPLKYITSRDEQVVLETINGDKRKFDKFWLNLTGSASRAKDIIKVYYGRVEEANAMFTTYKEGWRTDMGMIYSVMGTPDEVVKSFNEETWVYLANRNLPKRKYTFIRAASVFSKSHFVLIREKKHAEAWFEAIDLLRKGIFR